MTRKVSSPTIAQRQFSAKKRKLIEAQKIANKAALKAANEWLAKNSDCSDLKIRPMNIAYIKRNGSTTKAIIQLADRMTYPSNKDRTQKQILEDVRPSFVDVELHPSVWQKELSHGLLKKIISRVNGNLANKQSFTGCKTLSQTRKKIKASQQAATGKVDFKVAITFTKESVIIGKESYPYVMRGPNYCIRVTLENGKRCWVRVDGLVAALKKT